MSNIKEFDNILIVGLGLIGGSIAKKIKEIDYSANVYGFEKNLEILKEANKKGLVINDKEIDLKNSKNLLVIFCVPVMSFKQALNSVKKHLPSQNIIFTDTLSTKTEIFNILSSNINPFLSGCLGLKKSNFLSLSGFSLNSSGICCFSSTKTTGFLAKIIKRGTITHLDQ